MVEPLLYAALGFLTASLVALFFGRALWSRAVRLTTHRIMRRLPLSRDEIVASRDLLRAEFAIEHRRLERQANMMRERMTGSMADVGRRNAQIVGLRTEIWDQVDKLAAGEAREATGRKQIDQVKAEHAATRSKLLETERALANAQRELKESHSERRELVHLADDRRAEMAGIASEAASARQLVASLEKQVAAANKQAADTQQRLEQALDAQRLERDRAEAINAKLVATESQLAQALTRVEVDGRTAQAAIEKLRSERNSFEAQAAMAKLEHEGATRQADGDAEELNLLRQQIEHLARDIARAATGRPDVRSTTVRARPTGPAVQAKSRS